MFQKLQNKLWMLILLASITISAQDSYWKKSELKSNSQISRIQNLDKSKYQIHSLNMDALKTKLSNAPLRTASYSRSSVVVTFPTFDGKLEQFRVVEAPLLSPKMSAKYPNIKTYLGFSMDNSGARIRFSVTPQGVQTMTSYPNKPTLFTVPTTKGNTTEYITYDRGVRIVSKKDFECLTENEIIPLKELENVSRDANDQILRTFRIAISTDGEYTQHWDDGNAGNGDAQDDALAQVVSTLNRNNEVFEVDMAITFQLVTGTELIFPNPSSDPYTGNPNTQLQSTLTSVVGEANYDIGHLFSKDSKNGNAGCIGCVCVDNQKGSAFSAHDFLDNDGGTFMADFFDIDYVPHEIGHQMGALHTHAVADNNDVNFEPGSGTTIMGYAGITGSNDIQDHSDPYFHYGSINQIMNNVTNVRTCWTSTAITNNPPIANAGNDFTIPAGTAFVLKGVATDSDGGDVLTYTWEQVDDGITTSGNFGPTLSNGPVWRSRPPSTNPNRYMPILSRVMAGELTETSPTETVNNTSWETVSTVSRNLNFALTVRDRSEANGTGQFPQSSFDLMEVTVDANAGPFVVTSQTTNETWDVGSNQTVTWDVAGTDGGSVNNATVNILLSSDGGQTFPVVAASNVANDGNHTFVVPAVGGDSSQMRVMVEANNNIFFAVNSTNFTAQESEFTIALDNTEVEVCSPNDAVYTFTYNTFLGFNGTTNFSTTGLPSGTSASFNPTSASADGTQVTMTVSGTNNVAAGSYNFTVEGTSGSISKSASASLVVFDGTLNAPSLTSPSNGATDVAADGMLTWSSDANAESYLVEIATDNAFSNIVTSTTVTTNSYTTSLSSNTQYYWRVTPSNQCATGTTSSIFNFTTANITCNSFDATDLPISISTTGNITYETKINIGPDYPITDVNVTIRIPHTWAADLDIFLISPQGTRVELTTDNGGIDGEDYIDTVFDQEASTPITSGSVPFTGTYIPEGDLSTLYGEMSGGEWTLEVTDDANLDGGTMERFALDFCVQGDILSNEDIKGEIAGLAVFPNPSKGNFTVRFDNITGDDVTVRVLDLSGRTIFTRNYNSSTSLFAENVALSRVSSGLYLVQIINGNKQTTKKIIIE